MEQPKNNCLITFNGSADYFLQQKQSPAVRSHHISVVTTYSKSWILIFLLRYDTYVFLTFQAKNNFRRSPAMETGYLT